MKIAFFEIFNEIIRGEKEILENFFLKEEILYFNEKLSLENVNSVKDAEIISVFTGSVVNKEIIDLLPNLKFINTSSTGFDHIDINYCREKGIKVSNVPAYGSVTVAEFTFALLLTLSRKIYDAYDHLKEDGDFNIYSLRGFDLRGKTFGVIGTGKIGKNVIKIAKGFGMNIIAYDLYPDANFAGEYNFEYKSLLEVVAQADIISLHVPYSKESHHLINKDIVAKMKKGVYVLNTARGELIDTDALIWGLQEGIIAGAGLDVLEGERQLKEEIKVLSVPEEFKQTRNYKTLLEDHVLIDMPNVIVTPHIAFYSKEAEEAIIKTTIDNIKGYMEEKPINLVK